MRENRTYGSEGGAAQPSLPLSKPAARLFFDVGLRARASLIEYGFELQANPTNDYDAIIVAVNHADYASKSEADFKAMLADDKGIIVDLKGIYKGKINDIDYWSL